MTYICLQLMSIDLNASNFATTIGHPCVIEEFRVFEIIFPADSLLIGAWALSSIWESRKVISDQLDLLLDQTIQVDSMRLVSGPIVDCTTSQRVGKSEKLEQSSKSPHLS